MSTLRTFLSSLITRFETAEVDSPRLSAELILAHAMKTERAGLIKELIMDPGKPLDETVTACADRLARRREKGEPVAYITGVKEFYGRRFHVGPATLIPRPDTETLIEAALAFAKRHAGAESPPSFIDLGTGSGAIAVTLALELPDWHGIAVDISAEALDVAGQNAKNLGASNLTFLHCDFLEARMPQGPYDMLVANPPYVSEVEYYGLSREIADFEPKRALVPAVTNSDGFEYLCAIINLGARILRPGGLLLMEMGFAQGDILLNRAKSSSSWTDCRIVRDLAGLPRVFHAIRTGIPRA